MALVLNNKENGVSLVASFGVVRCARAPSKVPRPKHDTMKFYIKISHFYLSYLGLFGIFLSLITFVCLQDVNWNQLGWMKPRAWDLEAKTRSCGD